MSDYGPKNASQYVESDNVRRKSNNTGDTVELGQNKNVKSISTKPGQLSAANQAAHEINKYNKEHGIGEGRSVQLSDEEILEIAERYKDRFKIKHSIKIEE